MDLLELIDQRGYIDENSYHGLTELSKNNDPEIRSRVAELLVLADPDNQDAKEILISLLDDPDELVRTNACDSLCIFQEEKILQLLLKRAKEDSSQIVRVYALLSIGDIIKPSENNVQVYQDLKDLLAHAQTVKEKLALYRIFYEKGESELLCHILDELSNIDYDVRHAAINILQEVIQPENKTVIFNALNECIKKEETKSVKQKIQNFIKANQG